MRIGLNPNKNKVQETDGFFHQVIIPVYIPNQEGYFKDSFQIFKYSLESLFATCHSKTYFTLVNNGSCVTVVDFINALHRSGQVHEIIHTTNIGKLNAILKGITGQNFPMVTITDADVLFLNDWQEATYQVFTAFPKAGVVGPVPNPKMLRYHTANLLFDKLFSGELKFSKVSNPEAMKAFAVSVGTPELFNATHLKKYLTLASNNVTAVVGSGHFVATYNRRVFNKNMGSFSSFKMGKELSKFLDVKALKLGLWRLSTEDNYAFHMGNTKEDWMEERLKTLSANEKEITAPVLTSVKNNKFITGLKTRFFARLIFRKAIWKLFLRYKGLSPGEVSDYAN